MSLFPLEPAGTQKPARSIPKLNKELLPVWTSPGVSPKPEGCKECLFRTSGTGYVPDWYPDQFKEPQIGFLLATPVGDEVLEQRPWAGRAGYAWEKKYLKPFGLSLSDVFVGHVLRCQPKKVKWGESAYPIGSLRRSAEITCRKYDKTCWGGAETRPGGIHKFNPTLFVISFAPQDALQTPALGRLIEADVRKAVRKMEQGHRPLVLMGDEPRELVAPWTSHKGGSKTWRGHHWEGAWPWVEGSTLVEPQRGFIEA